MSIDRTSPLNPVSTVQHRETNDSPTLQQNPGKSLSANSTSVQLSDAQTKLTQSRDGDINLSRVEALKAAIRNGEVKMDTGKIADALIQETRHSLLGK